MKLVLKPQRKKDLFEVPSEHGALTTHPQWNMEEWSYSEIFNSIQYSVK